LRSAPSRRSPVRGSTVSILILLLLVALALQALRLPPMPHGSTAVSILRWITLGSLVTAVTMLVLPQVATAVVGRLPNWHEESAPEEEPHLPKPTAPRGRGRCPLVGFMDLEPGAGGSTVAFNLAVLIAVEGRPLTEDGTARRPRPLCLLSEGQLTEALDLDPDPVECHLDQNSGRIAVDLVDAAVRHPSGCELLCLPRGRVGRHQLRLLRLALDRYYDLVVVDCSAIDVDLREGVEDTADALIAVSVPSLRSADGAARLLEGTARASRLASTVLLVNQARAQPHLLDELAIGFGHLATLPHENLIPEADRRGLPWSLAPDFVSGHCLREFARELLPDLFDESHDAVPA
jgi:hypothetical protein